ncbi:MAG: zinc ribbon domain-containing protein [Methanobacteriota archaeon]
MPLREQLKAFLKTPWSRVLYVAVLGLFVGWMFAIFAFGVSVCLALLVIALTMFVVPFWFGERRPRRFLVNGLVIFAIALVVVASLRTQIVLSAPPIEIQSLEGLEPTLTLRNGTVEPFRADSTTTFTFRVVLYSANNSTAGEYEVFVNLTTIDGLAVSDQPYRMSPAPIADPNPYNGTLFTANVSLGEAVYGMAFAAHRPGDNWTFTPAILAPIAASGWTLFGFFFLYSTSLLALAFAFYLFILFLWWYSGRMRRTRAAMADRARELRKESPRAESGKAGKASAFTCTNCGADVTEDAASCPKCGAIFEE